MTSSHFMLSFELTQNMWRTFPRFRHILRWNSQTQRLESELNSYHIVKWYLGGLSLQLILATLSAFLLCIGLHTSESNKLMNWIIVTLWLMSSSHCILMNMHLIRDRETVVSYLNRMITYSEPINQKNISNKSLASNILQGVGYCAIAYAASVTITEANVLPFQIYWVFPSVLVFGIIVTHIALSQVTSCFQLSNRMIQDWKHGTTPIGKYEAKYVGKLAKSLRPISFYFGSFRQLNKEFKVVYIESIVGRVVDAVLLLH
ncbi:unnamed protein product [Orchesella dallaii]|uniref:Gustatory receptor n=1 Tax=Orchesella dallaii TaxID=48710 RepID=A0ABP1RQ87_9HEXA